MTRSEALIKYNEIDKRVGIKPFWEVRDIIDDLGTQLEELNNRNCDGCKFGKFGIDSIGVEIECSLNWDCSRGHKIDKFEKKG